MVSKSMRHKDLRSIATVIQRMLVHAHRSLESLFFLFLPLSPGVSSGTKQAALKLLKLT